MRAGSMMRPGGPEPEHWAVPLASGSLHPLLMLLLLQQQQQVCCKFLRCNLCGRNLLRFLMLLLLLPCCPLLTWMPLHPCCLLHACCPLHPCCPQHACCQGFLPLHPCCPLLLLL